MQLVEEMTQVVHEVSQALHLFTPLSVIENEPSKASQTDYSTQVPSGFRYYPPDLI